ncbi:MAG: UrcA family protein [Sphingomonas bacterium]|nr:UrcA family protein [Sphingomonas bacterium]
MKHLVLLCAGLLATPVLAADANPLAAEKAVVNLAGLDLATASGQNRLAMRLDQAAADVCGRQLAEIHLAVAAKGRACRTEVVAEARAKIEARFARNELKATQLASR